MSRAEVAAAIAHAEQHLDDTLGRLAELGTHAELVAESGAYAALWDSWHGTAAKVSR